MFATKAAQLSSKALVFVSTRSAAVSRAAPMPMVAADSWEKGSMVFKDPLEERDTAYLKATSANGLMMEGTLLTEEASYLSEAHVDYMYKGPCDNTNSLQLNSATQFMLENSGTSQPINDHYATIGGHVPMAANLTGTGLSHLHFKGSSSGLGCKFVSSNLLSVHPSRQLHTSATARQQGVQGDVGGSLEIDLMAVPVNAQGIQGDADSAQARLWVGRCLGDGLYTDCAVPPEAMTDRRRRTVQELFVQMLLEIRSAAELQLKAGPK